MNKSTSIRRGLAVLVVATLVVSGVGPFVHISPAQQASASTLAEPSYDYFNTTNFTQTGSTSGGTFWNATEVQGNNMEESANARIHNTTYVSGPGKIDERSRVIYQAYPGPGGGFARALAGISTSASSVLLKTNDYIGLDTYNNDLYISTSNETVSINNSYQSHWKTYEWILNPDGNGTLNVYDDAAMNSLANSYDFTFNASANYDVIHGTSAKGADSGVTDTATMRTAYWYHEDAPKTTTLSGTVFDQDGNTLENATLEYVAHSDGSTYNTTSNSTGDYSIGLPDGKYNTTYTKPGYKQKTGYVDTNETTTEDVYLFEVNASLSGYLVNNRTGQAIAGANVTAIYEDEFGIKHFDRTTTSSISGYYELDLEADYYNVSVVADGYESKSNESINWYIDESVEKTYYLDQSSDNTVSGHVYDSAGNGLDHALVSADGIETYTNATGYYELNLSDGEWDLTATKAGYDIDEYADVEITGDRTQDFVLNATHQNVSDDPANNNKVYGYVENSTGTAISGATVVIDGLATQTNSSGYYSFQIKDGTYDLQAFAEGYAINYKNNTAISSDTQIDFALTEDSTAVYYTISGDVTDVVGEALPNTWISANGYGDFSQTNGGYEFTVPEGTYDLTAEKDGYYTEYQNDTLVNSNLTINWELQEFTAAGEGEFIVNGTVYDDKNRELADAYVELKNQSSGNTTTVQSDHSGYYEATVPPGDYDVTAYKKLYQNDSQVLTVNEDRTEDFILNPVRSITLEAPDVLWQNSSAEYEVYYSVPAYDTYTLINDEATVSSSNSTILSVDNNANKLNSAQYKGTVNVTATYQDHNDSINITVANQTAENVDLFKNWGEMAVAMWGNPVNPETGEAPGGTQLTMAFLFIAFLFGVLAAGWASAFAGIGAVTIAMVFGWFMGWVGDGMVMITLFTGLFIGLNLASNVEMDIRN